MMRVCVALVAALTVGPVLAAPAKVYTWVDAKGVRHYSQTIPAGEHAESVTPKTQEAHDAPALDSLKVYVEQSDAQREQEEQHQANVEQLKQLHEKQEQECAQARSELEMMQSVPLNRQTTTDENGNVSRVTEDKWREWQAKTKSFLQDNCSKK